MRPYSEITLYWRPVAIAGPFQTDPDTHWTPLQQHGNKGCRNHGMRNTRGFGDRCRLQMPFTVYLVTVDLIFLTLFNLTVYGDQWTFKRGADGLGIFPSLALFGTARQVKQETLQAHTHTLKNLYCFYNTALHTSKVRHLFYDFLNINLLTQKPNPGQKNSNKSVWQ